MKKKIAFVVSSPMTASSFLLTHFKMLSKSYDVTLIVNLGDNLGNKRACHFFVKHIVNIPIERKILLINDVKTLYKLWRHFANNHYHAVHSVTPKAGLIAMLASKLARVKHRTHTFTGQVWVTKKGISRLILKLIDKLIFFSATFVLVDSISQRSFLIDNRIITNNRSTVLGKGSISGVDIEHFKFNQKTCASLRNELGIPKDAFVFLYLGRLYAEKGIDELLTAFTKFVNSDAYLLIVGPNEENFDHQYFQQFDQSRIRVKGGTNTPELFFSVADVFVLPSHREGFGTVVLEAAAAGVPSIGSNIYGLSDAIENGVTGLLHNVRDTDDLFEKMYYLCSNKAITKKMGSEALQRARNDFSSVGMAKEIVLFYAEKFGSSPSGR